MQCTGLRCVDSMLCDNLGKCLYNLPRMEAVAAIGRWHKKLYFDEAPKNAPICTACKELPVVMTNTTLCNYCYLKQKLAPH